MDPNSFYDKLAPFYHLIYKDWEKSVAKQASDIDKIIKRNWGNSITSVLDVACGIGTQSLGLASLGYKVTASDLSLEEVELAKQKANSQGLTIDFSVVDMREVHDHYQKEFDLVIACDNSITHLLSDSEIFDAFSQFRLCLRKGGGCIISVRDYDKESREGVQIKPYGIRIEGDRKFMIFQVWEYHGMIYDMSMYFVEDKNAGDCVTHVMRTKYYAIGIEDIMKLMSRAGFSEVKCLNDGFFQPVIIGQSL